MSTSTPEESAAAAAAAAGGGGSDYDYDRLSELKAFDDTKAGVKGLVDAGVTTIPAIFHHHHLHLHDEQAAPAPSSSSSSSSSSVIIPVIDLSAAEADAAGREEVVAQVKAAAETVGFFQVVNHGVPVDLLSEMLESVRRFNEEDSSSSSSSSSNSKRGYYTRDPRRKLRFNSNFDLFQSPAANWRDTLFCEAAPDPPRASDLPPAVRGVMLEYAGAVRVLAARVLALLSEALLGPNSGGRLAGMGCADGVSLVCNYYPPCPEPELTMGCSRHSDPSFLTVLLQDEHEHGGLQVLLLDGSSGSSRRWVDVPPVAGALVVNVGDLLQLVSNGRFRSVEHRVVANRSRDTARVSVACFCNADIARSTRLYGPIPELIADGEGRAAMYKSVTVPEFLAHYDKKGLDGRPALHHFQLLQ